MNGILVSAGGPIVRRVNGLSVSSYIGFAGRSRGVFANALWSAVGDFSGVTVGAFNNVGRGLVAGALVIVPLYAFVDALIIGGRCRRPVRFVMDYDLYTTPGLQWLFRLARVIPIASARRSEAVLEAAYDRIAAELEAGRVVCLFPKGQITRDGELSAFRYGVERIVERTPVPVVPMALQGLWSSLFSRKERSFARTGVRSLFTKIGLRVGAPLAPERVTAPALEHTVRGLRGAWR